MALTKPQIGRIDGAPPTDLVITDVTVGDGPEATVGQKVTVHYVGVAFDTGAEFDSSWSRQEPFSFPLGAGHVIAGWVPDRVTWRIVVDQARSAVTRSGIACRPWFRAVSKADRGEEN
jgi:peptidylprolyl isomerase